MTDMIKELRAAGYTEAQIYHTITYFQRWHKEYSAAARFHMTMDEFDKAEQMQKLAAIHYRMVTFWRDGSLTP